MLAQNCHCINCRDVTLNAICLNCGKHMGKVTFDPRRSTWDYISVHVLCQKCYTEKVGEVNLTEVENTLRTQDS